MSQENFKRYEKKYMLTKRQYHSLMLKLAGKMELDQYGKHTISNLYFDTEDFRLIRNSIEKPAYKEKLRLRAYGNVNGESAVFLELKKKFDKIVYKRRISMKLEEARRYLLDGIYPQKDSQILREIDFTLKKYDLKPAACVFYDRMAFYGKEDEMLRVTFDRNIRCRSTALDLERGTYGVDILEQGCVLMEVKMPNAMPLWMGSCFSELGIYPLSYSKYGTYYKKYLFQNYFMEGGTGCA